MRPQRANTSAALNRGQPPAVELPVFNTPPPVRRAEAADSSDEDSSDVCHKPTSHPSSWDVLWALSLYSLPPHLHHLHPQPHLSLLPHENSTQRRRRMARRLRYDYTHTAMCCGR